MHVLRRIASAALLASAFSFAHAQTAAAPSPTTQTSTQSKAAAASNNKATAASSKAAAAKPSANSGEQIDINTATADQLKAIPGIGDAYATKIIAGRPYTAKNQLTTKGVIPQSTYDKIKDQIVAHRAKK
jgi:DNA uptake protein ComE-like DNA-binding protein